MIESGNLLIAVLCFGWSFAVDFEPVAHMWQCGNSDPELASEDEVTFVSQSRKTGYTTAEGARIFLRQRSERRHMVCTKNRDVYTTPAQHTVYFAFFKYFLRINGNILVQFRIFLEYIRFYTCMFECAFWNITDLIPINSGKNSGIFLEIFDSTWTFLYVSQCVPQHCCTCVVGVCFVFCSSIIGVYVSKCS